MSKYCTAFFKLCLIVCLLLFSGEQPTEALSEILSSSQASDLFYQGIEQTEKSNYSQAILDFTQVINSESKWVTAAYTNRCLVHLNLNQNQAAKSDCTEAIKRNSNQTDVYLNLGLAEYRLGNYYQALSQYQEVIKRDKENYQAYYNQGLVYVALQDYSQALKNYEQALLSEKLETDEQKSLIYNEKGLAYFNSGDMANSLTELTQSISLNPVNDQAYYNRGCIHYKTQHYLAAIDDFNQVIKLNSDSAQAYVNRGISYYAMGLEQAALRDLNRALHQFDKQEQLIAYQQTLNLINQLKEKREISGQSILA
ncbi:tetratricopeptide repeat protein [Aphanothece sacrum]|uniref:Tetratricopeptide repeat domain protein n=1 Tax=Aphanothece sacrum FPU1 TaxID=1920663 RepID=A0A401IHA1_APHSA|nr:tetratricopeptide repeat protein [Aphanothece sacrum]GBF80663.1 tetratricopeptide repeat domain protein [Aphanothece sacrum FPU1]GBF83157.1 tetratricopeptide repeat protein [Aphanothece sacrum FPU3]